MKMYLKQQKSLYTIESVYHLILERPRHPYLHF